MNYKKSQLNLPTNGKPRPKGVTLRHHAFPDFFTSLKGWSNSTGNNCDGWR